MLYGFRNGAAETIRLAKRYADANGLAGLNCADAQPSGQPPGTLHEGGIINWTVRLDGLPRGPYDDGSVIVFVCLQTGEARRLGGTRSA